MMAGNKKDEAAAFLEQIIYALSVVSETIEFKCSLCGADIMVPLYMFRSDELSSIVDDGSPAIKAHLYGLIYCARCHTPDGLIVRREMRRIVRPEKKKIEVKAAKGGKKKATLKKKKGG